MKQRTLVFLIFPLVLSLVVMPFVAAVPANADEATVLSEELVFHAKAGETVEKNVTLRVRSEREIPIKISIVGDIKNWVQVNQTSFYARAASPISFTVNMTSPPDVPLGVYKGIIMVNAISSGDAVTTTISKTMFLKIKVNITETSGTGKQQPADITLPLKAPVVLFYLILLIVLMVYIVKKRRKTGKKKYKKKKRSFSRRHWNH